MMQLPAIRSQAHRYEKALSEKAVSQQDYDQIVSKAASQAAAVQADEAAVEKANILRAVSFRLLDVCPLSADSPIYAKSPISQ